MMGKEKEMPNTIFVDLLARFHQHDHAPTDLELVFLWMLKFCRVCPVGDCPYFANTKQHLDDHIKKRHPHHTSPPNEGDLIATALKMAPKARQTLTDATQRQTRQVVASQLLCGSLSGYRQVSSWGNFSTARAPTVPDLRPSNTFPIANTPMPMHTHRAGSYELGNSPSFQHSGRLRFDSPPLEIENEFVMQGDFSQSVAPTAPGPGPGNWTMPPGATYSDGRQPEAPMAPPGNQQYASQANMENSFFVQAPIPNPYAGLVDPSLHPGQMLAMPTFEYFDPAGTTTMPSEQGPGSFSNAPWDAYRDEND